MAGLSLRKVFIFLAAVLPTGPNAAAVTAAQESHTSTIAQKEGVQVEPRIAEKPGFKVIGIEFCIDMKAADYAGMWNSFVSQKEKLARFANGRGDYGLFHRYCGDGKVGYLLGVAVDSITTVPDGFMPLDIPPALYAVFQCNSETVGETWPYIHGEWLPSSKEYAMTNGAPFEFYPPDYGTKSKTILIHIPIEKKANADQPTGKK